VTRSRRRVRVGALVVYAADAAFVEAADVDIRQPSRIGLIVGRAVGRSVVRHQVARRLRAQLFLRLGALNSATDLVIRALPGAGRMSSAALGRALDEALRRLGANRAAASGRPALGTV